ncbi:MAG: hypothetical protein CMC88_06255 [Flavobacteriaceae bacterium]|nr:hypothetical protein [Flavobacteriaceae bacterium]|tara:strand:+ start:85948 stop:86148 length:201 start_codon:yes stop_codon:yes gene_type:complete
MNKLLYTFFFGYAALKWRRLIRVLIPVFLFSMLATDSEAGIMIIVWSPVYVPIISWLIKPFVVDEK